jgi:hypothetical protein
MFLKYPSTAASLLMLNLTGRDKGGYYHELFLRSKRFLSHRIDRMKIKGTGARKPGSPETEPGFYNAPFLPSTSVSGKNAQVSSMVSNMMALGPNMYPGTGGAMSLHNMLAYPAYGISLPHHQVRVAPPPLFRSSASLLMEARQAQQARLQQLRMVPFYPDMHTVPGFGQHHIPMVSAPQNISNANAMALAFSCLEQDQATRAQTRSLYM